MKFSLTVILAASVAFVSAIDIGSFGERTIINLNLTPACAQICIFNPKWARRYAPECADLPLGVEYATKLCENYIYQHMLDNCIKGKCNDSDRKKVICSLSHTDFRQGNWERTLVRVSEYTQIYLHGNVGINHYRILLGSLFFIAILSICLCNFPQFVRFRIS